MHQKQKSHSSAPELLLAELELADRKGAEASPPLPLSIQSRRLARVIGTIGFQRKRE
jgi:hypothetical protein